MLTSDGASQENQPQREPGTGGANAGNFAKARIQELQVTRPAMTVESDTPTSVDLSRYKRPAVSDAVSLFRYPGGKGFLAGFLAHKIEEWFHTAKPTFVEPFAGERAPPLIYSRIKLSRKLL